MAGRIGYNRCGVCGNPEATVDEKPTGTLATGCHKCGFSGYAKAGTKAKRLILAGMTPEAEDTTNAPAPQAATAPTPTPTPPAATKRTGGTLMG